MHESISRMLKEDHYSINKSFVSDKAVFRTAQATPVLLILMFSVKVTEIIYISIYNVQYELNRSEIFFCGRVPDASN